MADPVFEEENNNPKEPSLGTHYFSEIIGISEPMQKIFGLMKRVSASDTTVLLQGETGTGKELVARAIHEFSARSKNRMIKVNCAALPANLIESELFGHEKGSFTGAHERRIGKFELANHGTIFLDEIGELPMELQVKLLRVLQEMEIERIGGHATLKVNVRVIAATNRDLREEVEKGRFRSDLFYRLNVFPLTIPALRDRPEDIEILSFHYLGFYAGKTEKEVTGISKRALRDLKMYHWPGNVRELQHLIERSVVLTDSPVIKNVELPVSALHLSANHTSENFTRTLEEVERDYILGALRKLGGRVSGPQGAAVRLGIPSTTLISKMKKLGIKKGHFIQNN
jgi:formate hydrogenlyase transcriptional activator